MREPTPVESLRSQIGAAVARIAVDPSIPLRAVDITPVTEAVVQKVAPAILHATNNEPWYKSRVTWGAIIAVAGPLLSVLGVSSDLIDPDLAVSISTALVSVVGGALTLYGRWKARKPIVSGG